ncbi:hypothetical protein HMPREF9599_01415 [Cutibacterium acnes HL050PA2]|nr:hypothetical protein HMPREF9599_01415 [Cutibacterium acnes HL050PA2]
MIECATFGKARPSLLSSNLDNLLLYCGIVLTTETTDHAGPF